MCGAVRRECDLGEKSPPPLITTTLGHLAKVGLFGATGFAFAEHAPLLALGSACAIGGTWLGSRLLDKLSEASFLWLYRSVLTGLALRLVWKSLPI